MNALRIIAGTYGGRLIKTPSSSSTHPMGDRERGAIMNALQHDLKNATILDAFAGSGAIGLEALSRGASSVTFLENHKKALQTITANIQKLGVTHQTKVIKIPANINDQFDIIIADPPYDTPQYTLIIKLLKHLKPGGIFILSHGESAPPPTFSSLMLISNKTYAAAHIKIYKNLV